MLLLTHTRTEVIALVAGLLVAGLSMFAVRVRVRRLFGTGAITVSVAVIAFSSVLTTWLARGESSHELIEPDRPDQCLDRRAQRAARLVADDRSASACPTRGSTGSHRQQLDRRLLRPGPGSGWPSCAAFLLFVLVNAFFQPRGSRRALALFLVTYLIVTSYTETGLSNASMYLFELALAASLLVPAAPEGVWYAGVAGP